MIYILDNDPKKTAEYLDDKSLDRMIKDIAQVLCNVQWLRTDISDNARADYIKSIPLVRKASWNAIAWTQWVRECKANYLYLVDLLYECLMESRYRSVNYKGKYYKVLCFARDNVPDLPSHCHSCALCYNETKDGCKHFQETTPFPLVMPKKYLQKTLRFPWTENHTVESYRNYYQAKLIKKVFWCIPRTDQALKDHGIIWTNRNKPEWLKF